LQPLWNFPQRWPVSTKLRNLPAVETMQTRRRGNPSRIDRLTGIAGTLSLLVTCGTPVMAYARQTATDRTQPHAKTMPDAPAPPADAQPSGDPKSGVVKPPDIDPKMAKPVPDVDPAMDNPTPGKTPAPQDPSAPRLQPK